MIIREEDCGTERGLPTHIGAAGSDGVVRVLDNVDTSAASRVLSDDVVVDGKTLAARGDELSLTLIDELVAAGVRQSRRVRC